MKKSKGKGVILCIKCKDFIGKHEGIGVKWGCCSDCLRMSAAEKVRKFFDLTDEQKLVRDKMKRYMDGF